MSGLSHKLLPHVVAPLWGTERFSDRESALRSLRLLSRASCGLGLVAMGLGLVGTTELRTGGKGADGAIEWRVLVLE